MTGWPTSQEQWDEEQIGQMRAAEEEPADCEDRALTSLNESRERLRLALNMIANFNHGRGMSIAECANLARRTLDEDEAAVASSVEAIQGN